MYEVVREFNSDGVPVKTGPLAANAIPQDHLECATRNGWVVPVEKPAAEETKPEPVPEPEPQPVEAKPKPKKSPRGE